MEVQQQQQQVQQQQQEMVTGASPAEVPNDPG